MSNDLDTLLRTPVIEIIDADIISAVLSSPPFIQVDGLFNLRDVSDGSQPALKQDYCFRCGSLEKITDAGKSQLRELGIKTIFDLRSARETTEHPDPEIDGIELVAAQTDTDPLQAVKYGSLVEMYMDMLSTHKAVWSKVLSHVLHHPDRPFLVHCTGGKDRTGLAICLILSIARVPPSYIVRDYALTRIGIEPVREFLLSKLTGGKPGMEDLLKSERMQMFMRINPEVLEEVLTAMQERWGGVEEYVVQELGFGVDDLEVMRKNLGA